MPENLPPIGHDRRFRSQLRARLDGQRPVKPGVRHEFSRFEIPNELVQEQAGQLQTGDNLETMGTVSYQHIFSPNRLGTLAGMVRDNANDLDSNP